MKVQFDDLTILIFNAASEEAQHVRHPYVTPEHIFFCALQFHFVRGVFELLDVDILELEEEIHRYLSYINESIAVEKSNDAMPKHSPGFDKFLEYSLVHMYKSQSSYITIKNILHALIDIEEVQATRFLKSRNITHEKISKVLNNKSFEKYLKDKHDENMNSSFDIREALSIEDVEQEEYGSSFYVTTKHQEDDETFLKKFTSVLSRQREEHDVFVGQEAAIRNVFEVLVRQRKNNVILVGDPGVGKTALVRELGSRIFAKDVPEGLEEFVLLELNIVALIAGTRYRGDFEDRVRRLTHALSDKKCIIFIDEIHTILGIGGSSSSTNDLSDFIKPLLMEANIRFIGATTFEEYKKLEREKALFRRFYPIEVSEPNGQETEQILRSVRLHYEKFYNIQYSDDVLHTVVHLGNDFLRERRFPDKAIDILDSVGAMLVIDKFAQKREQLQNANVKRKDSGDDSTRSRIKKEKPRIITEKQVETLISRMTKRPVASVAKNEFMRLIVLEDKLNKKIFGQEHAVQAVVRAIRRAKSGVATAQKPLLSTLFVGPTGVGKTELSKQLAEELGMEFHRFDMSEYQEKHAVSKFIGSPPGYVGHEHGGVFVDKVRRTPHSVVLLDEIEKAHSDVFNLLLQIMDYGFITDSLGTQADFRNAILIMTSNVGVQEAIKAPIGFEYMAQKGSGEINDAVNKLFSPEFRNRLDEIIIFNPLTLADIRGVVIKELKAIKENLMKKRITLTWTARVVLYLAHVGYSPIFGARNVIRTIDREIRDIIAEHVVNALSKFHRSFHIGSDNQSPVRLELYMKRSSECKTKKTVDVRAYINNVLITSTSKHTQKMSVA